MSLRLNTANWAASTDAEALAWLTFVYNEITALGWVVDTADVGRMSISPRTVTDGAVSTGANTTLTSATANFTAGDIGRRVSIAGAGASGATYTGNITAVASSTSCTIAGSISTTVSSTSVTISVGVVGTSGLTFQGYFAFKAADSLASTCPIYLRLYVGFLPTNGMKIEVSTSVGQTGNHTTTSTVRTASGAGGNCTHIFSGDAGRLQMYINAGSLNGVSTYGPILSICRLCDSAGTYVDDGIFILQADSASGQSQQTLGKPGGSIGTGLYFAYISAPYLTTSTPPISAPDAVQLCPAIPWCGKHVQDIAYGARGEATTFAVLSTNVFGGTKKYVTSSLSTSFQIGSTSACMVVYFRGE